MAGKVAEIRNLLSDSDQLASNIAAMWERMSADRVEWYNEVKERRNYIFATDTTKTTNAKLPWRNKTTMPKLCQIRDNLHANYMAALFPNDNWLRWEAYTLDSAEKQKAKNIEAYMQNKLRISDFKDTVSKIVYDYIDTGNGFGDVDFVAEYAIDEETGEKYATYVGPKLIRIAPVDIVFNPLSTSFKDSYKIVRYIKTLGELYKEAQDKPEYQFNLEIIKQAQSKRVTLSQYSEADLAKAEAYSIDGFGSLLNYYSSDYVEILEFDGCIHDPISGEFLDNHTITIIDRKYVIRNIKNPSYFRKSPKEHVGWRYRPDNLYAMGPLDNLVGLQYRIDHLENMKADALDLTILPPHKIRGNVEAFEWGPLAEIQIGDDGDVIPMPPNPAAFQVNNEIIMLMNMMEEMSGAPRQALGIRTPGEKTAFEIQTLENNSQRTFMAKIIQFEEFLEKLLNSMLESSRRNLDIQDTIKTMDTDLGVETFINISKEDITGKGKLRPIGARHFAMQAQLLQSLIGLSNSAVWAKVQQHFSGEGMATLLEDALNISRYGVVKSNIHLFEQAETQKILNGLQGDIQETEAMPVPV
jgi:hypothetical protein